jgi:polyketide biosynthesis enoyl-CoA hydratase PksH
MEAAVPYRMLRVRAEPGLLWATLDRPRQQNTINGAVLAELHAVLDQAERSPDCRLVVLAGTDGVFCTGMDFADASRTDGDSTALAERGGAEFLGLLKRFTTVPRAVVSVVDGRVAGGGVGIAAASDFVYATPRSTFGLPEALWGLLPCCVLPFLIRRVGFQPAYAMTLSTLPVTADQAYRTHLVDEVAEDAELPIRRLRLRLSKLDGSTIADLKRYLRGMWFLSEEMERSAVGEFTRLMSSPAVRERISSFATQQVFPWESRR